MKILEDFLNFLKNPEASLDVPQTSPSIPCHLSHELPPLIPKIKHLIPSFSRIINSEIKIFESDSLQPSFSLEIGKRKKLVKIICVNLLHARSMKEKRRSLWRGEEIIPHFTTVS
jgi:hypothetical protein